MEDFNNIINNIKNLSNQYKLLEDFKKEAEETCEANAVIQDMLKRVEKAEEHVKIVIIEKELYEKIDNMDIKKLILKENKDLLEWYISYKLGVKLVYDYNLIPYKIIDTNNIKMIIPDKSKKINENISLGYNGGDYNNNILNHFRFDFNAQIDYIENKKIIDLFNKFFYRNTIVIRSHKGGIGYKIVSIWRKTYNQDDIIKIWDKQHTNDYHIFMLKNENEMSGCGTREIIYNFLTNSKLYE